MLPYYENKKFLSTKQMFYFSLLMHKHVYTNQVKYSRIKALTLLRWLYAAEANS